MKTDSFKRLLFLIAVAYLFPLAIVLAQVESQESNGKATNKTLTKVIRKTGWTTPALNQNERVTSSKVLIDEELVKSEFFRPQTPEVMKLGNYYLKGDGTLVIEEQDVEPRSMTTFSIDNKMFAIEVRFVIVRIDEKSKAYTGAIARRTFIDENGDQIFETMDSDSPVKIPRWAL